jgi:hypothetical protein
MSADAIGDFMRSRRYRAPQPDNDESGEQEADAWVDLDAAAQSPPREIRNNLRGLLEEARDSRTLGRRFKR